MEDEDRASESEKVVVTAVFAHKYMIVEARKVMNFLVDQCKLLQNLGTVSIAIHFTSKFTERSMRSQSERCFSVLFDRSSFRNRTKFMFLSIFTFCGWPIESRFKRQSEERASVEGRLFLPSQLHHSLPDAQNMKERWTC
jgi:hypothetical protein